jgi:CRISPR system Cascade subunit CasC
MKSIELHIVRSLPVNCVNRDGSGSPKSAIIGGTRRSRISSQCQKKAVRDQFLVECPKFADSKRTRMVIPLLTAKLIEAGISEANASELAKVAAIVLCGAPKAKKDDKKKGKKVAPEVVVEALPEALPEAEVEEETGAAKTIIFISSGEVDSIVNIIKKFISENPDATKSADTKKYKALSASLAKEMKKNDLSNGADIALHGRMITSQSVRDMTIEGACSVAHAFSVHRCENEIDFYSAVDEVKSDEDESGASMIGDIEFNSSCFYQNFAINLSHFAHLLRFLEVEDRQKIIACYVKCWLTTIPSARKNSMFANAAPSYVMAVVREGGQGCSYANAFERAIESNDSGYIDSAISAIKGEHERSSRMIPSAPVCVLEIPGNCEDINKFCAEIAKYVE